MIRSTRRTRATAALLALASSLLTSACVSLPLPPRLDPPLQARVEATHIAATVAVESGVFPVPAAERLAEALQRSSLFDRVEVVGRLDSAPDLVVRVEGLIHGTASVLPFLTVATLGIIPTWAPEEHGAIFSIRRPGTRHGEVPIEFVYRGPTILGWAALLANASPDRTSTPPETTDRFHEALAAAIVTREDRIRRLLR